MKNIFYSTTRRYFKCLFCTLHSAPLPFSVPPHQAWSPLVLQNATTHRNPGTGSFSLILLTEHPPLGLQLIQLVPNPSPYHLLKIHALSPPLSLPSLFPKGQSGPLSLPPCLLLWEVSSPNLPRTCMNMRAESTNSRGSSLYFLAFLTLPVSQTESLFRDQATTIVR